MRPRAAPAPRWTAFSHTVTQWLFTVLNRVEGFVSSGNTRAVFLYMMFAACLNANVFTPHPEQVSGQRSQI